MKYLYVLIIVILWLIIQWLSHDNYWFNLIMNLSVVIFLSSSIFRQYEIIRGKKDRRIIVTERNPETFIFTFDGKGWDNNLDQFDTSYELRDILNQLPDKLNIDERISILQLIYGNKITFKKK